MLLYYIRRKTAWRNGVAIIASLLFYAWGEPIYVFLMLFTVLANWIFARRMDGSSNDRYKLIAAIIIDLGFLAIFKYTDFIVGLINDAFGLKLALPGVPLPIGISFYTFQVISYVIDVYRGKVPAQRSYALLLEYICLFPQLIAGPIVRYDHIMHRLEGPRNISEVQVSKAIERFIVGLAKKVILANTCGALASEWLDPTKFSDASVATAWLGIIMYALQIYFDFSAYSDMAIAMGKMLGFHYHENFNYPYISKSPTEFWRRWHISLGEFFRDYVYIPLGGNRKRQYLNLFIVWFLTGLWHGAGVSFILWGMWWFVFVSLDKLFLKNVFKKLPLFFSHVYTILIFLGGWVFFYYNDVGDALALFPKFVGIGADFITHEVQIKLLNNIFFIVIALFACLPIVPLLRKIYSLLLAKVGVPQAAILYIIKYTVLSVLLVLSTVMLVGNNYNPFIYFKF